MSREAHVRLESGNDADTEIEIEYLKRLLERVTQVRGTPHEEAQSGLAILTIVLSSVVLQELAKGLANLFQRDRSATVEITLDDGKSVKISGVSQESALVIYNELSKELKVEG